LNDYIKVFFNNWLGKIGVLLLMLVVVEALKEVGEASLFELAIGL